jgi:hypothetical protein
VAQALDEAGIGYTSGDGRDGNQGYLDFELHFNPPVWIECKQFYSPRADRQLRTQADIILIQGRRAAEAFASMITKARRL